MYTVIIFNWNSLHVRLHASHGDSRKKSAKKLKHAGNLLRKNLQLKGVC